MIDPSFDIAALLCSKLCHDLLSPVGSISNGLELLADETDPVMRDRCFDLVTDSATTSANKLKYYRLAFGAAGGFGERVDPAEAKSLVESLISDNSRITLGWVVGEAALPKKAVKILLNLALIARESLVRGGQLDIGAEENAHGVEVVVRATAEKLVIDDGVRQALEGTLTPEQLTPRTVAAWLSRELAVRSGGDLRISPPSAQELLLGAIVSHG
jgi:histidine phosphotransferase ChpT